MIHDNFHCIKAMLMDETIQMFDACGNLLRQDLSYILVKLTLALHVGFMLMENSLALLRMGFQTQKELIA
jgi:hypothetical protein